MIGSSIAHYRITSKLGEGGMGEVYRATDTKLSRDVAVKVLPAAFAGNVDRMARFEREAKVLAQLNHPGIAAIYGVEERALVMELVEGATLAERIKESPIPLEEALRIANQIAEALDYAHEKGIIHRDLKPANVKITAEGQVKILDFGLAKAVTEDSTMAERSENSPTLTMGATQAGVILGTAGYMSPEQAKGKRADKRADIWAFGVVLHEMLTGKRLFEGETVSEALAAVLLKDPDLNAVPEQARPILQACLEKDPKKRLRDIGDLKRIPPVAVAPAAALAPVRPKISYVPWAAGAIGLLAALVLGWMQFRETPQQQTALRYTIPAPEKTRVRSFAVSPDGRSIVTVAIGEKGDQLWVRDFDSLEPRLLVGTEGASYPFWSPDSRFIAFFAEGKLKKIAVSGGPAQTLCDGPEGRGGDWNREGAIVFVPANNFGAVRVSAAGGVPVQITKPSDGATHRFPIFLPDGSRFLYVVTGGKADGVYLASLDSKPDEKEHRRVLADGSNVQYVPPTSRGGSGHLLFVREQTLMAQPVNPETLDAAGEVFPLAQRISRGVVNNLSLFSLFSVSSNGVLAYLTGGLGLERQHTWFDRTGKELGKVGGRMVSRDFALSPDAKRVVVEKAADTTSARSGLWMLDLEHSTESRFTFEGSNARYPVWSHDGSRVAFSSIRTGTILNLYQKGSDGAGKDELLLESPETKSLRDWSHDGKYLIFVQPGAKSRQDLWAFALEDKKQIPILQSEYNERMARLSPDDRWLAYVSDETGREEVYVVPFAPRDAAAGKSPSGKWQISTAGGRQPAWRADGRELFYIDTDRKLMSVDVRATASSFDRGTPQALFELRFNPDSLGIGVYRYAPTADGKRFLISDEPGATGETPPVTVVQNWLASVNK